jgi:cell division protein YceG involved in septum cleavage
MNLRKTSEKTLGLTIKISVYLILVIVLYTLGLKGFRFGEAVFSEKGVTEQPGTDVKISIDAGDSVMDVAGKAVDAGLAKDKLVFYVQSLVYEAEFLPYTYTINNSLPAEEIIEIMSEEPTTEAE